MDIEKIKKIAKEEEKDIVSFLREIISIESKSGNEEAVAKRIAKEMEDVGMDEVYIDDVGSVIGRIGNGRKKILYDSHIDTVGVSSSWKFDPYKGKVENGRIYGLGASDNKGGMASMVYGAKIINKARIEFDGTLYIAGVVQEEDCEG
ncbi:MAG: M20/M25/M40 family metallo-hydrolase, partial [Candidatus Thermoplasmatota archaeon]